ncbi:MAG: PAS domain-containing protein [Deltaproteobacteria bacterium]|nr:PAS domain-containing protein [Deltaproteobacteria bacterium]
MRRELRTYTENLEVLVREKSAKLVEAERQIAAEQVVEGLSSVMRDISDDLQGGIRYFNEMPCFVSIHNRDLKIVATNQIFKERLGDKIGSNSWEIYKDGAGRNETCPVRKTFQTGKGLRIEETVKCLDGKELPVVVHTAPIRGSEQDVELVLEISADITEVNRLQEFLMKHRVIFPSRTENSGSRPPTCVSKKILAIISVGTVTKSINTERIPARIA